MLIVIMAAGAVTARVAVTATGKLDVADVVESASREVAIACVELVAGYEGWRLPLVCIHLRLWTMMLQLALQEVALLVPDARIASN